MKLEIIRQDESSLDEGSTVVNNDQGNAKVINEVKREVKACGICW